MFPVLFRNIRNKIPNLKKTFLFPVLSFESGKQSLTTKLFMLYLNLKGDNRLDVKQFQIIPHGRPCILWKLQLECQITYLLDELRLWKLKSKKGN